MKKYEPFGFPTDFDYCSWEANIFWQRKPILIQWVFKGGKLSPQNTSWNFFSWSLWKSDYFLFNSLCHYYTHLPFLLCFPKQETLSSVQGWSWWDALARNSGSCLGCSPARVGQSLLLNRHWGLTAHLFFFFLFYLFQEWVLKKTLMKVLLWRSDSGKREQFVAETWLHWVPVLGQASL